MTKKHYQKRPHILKILILLLTVLLTVILYRISQSDSEPTGTTLKTILADLSNRTATDTSEDWELLLVNRTHKIPINYSVTLTELSNGKKVDQRIYPSLQQMFDDARATGLALFVREGYRTAEDQQQIMDERITKYENQGYSKTEATKLAEEYIAIPGTSEHQLGLSVDINADTTKCSSEKVYQWLDKNAWKYGFIKRYPSDKTDITGISNEPWHYRYVGKDAAKTMKEENLCLEEYLKKYKNEG